MTTLQNPKRSVPATRGAAVAAAGAALAAVFLALAVCTPGSQPGKTDGLTATFGAATATADPTDTDQDPYDQLAMQMLDAIVAGDFAAVTAHFDPPMQQGLTPDALGSDWATYQQQFGPYQSHEDPQQVQRVDLIVVDIPLDMQLQPGDLRVAFHNGGTVAGLWLLRPGVPVT
jgi:hypothetical protein